MKNLTSLTHDKAFKAIAKECPEFFYNLLHLITGIDINRIKAGKLLDTKFINSKKRFKDLDLLFIWVSVKKILDKKKQKMLITFSAFLLKIKVNTSKI